MDKKAMQKIIGDVIGEFLSERAVKHCLKEIMCHIDEAEPEDQAQAALEAARGRIQAALDKLETQLAKRPKVRRQRRGKGSRSRQTEQPEQTGQRTLDPEILAVAAPEPQPEPQLSLDGSPPLVQPDLGI